MKAKPLTCGYVVLHQMDLSPAILRLDRIDSYVGTRKGTAVRYNNGHTYIVKETVSEIDRIVRNTKGPDGLTQEEREALEDEKDREQLRNYGIR